MSVYHPVCMDAPMCSCACLQEGCSCSFAIHTASAMHACTPIIYVFPVCISCCIILLACTTRPNLGSWLAGYSGAWSVPSGPFPIEGGAGASLKAASLQLCGGLLSGPPARQSSYELCPLGLDWILHVLDRGNPHQTKAPERAQRVVKTICQKSTQGEPGDLCNLCGSMGLGHSSL